MIDKDYVCEDYGTEKIWTQIKVTVKLEALETLTSIMSMVSNNLQIEDYSDMSLETCQADYLDEKLLHVDKSVASVSVYIPGETSLPETVAFLRERLAFAGLNDAKIETVGVNEEDWANTWKAYYKPIKIGEKLVIVPAWENYNAENGELIVRMDPGMAFGTGTHETTRLVISLLEKYVKSRQNLLDVGTGSGILAICGAKLGAVSCKAYDIDPVAVRVARENVKDNGFENIITVNQSDLLKSVDGSKPYDVICANIVADIILRMSTDIGNFMDDNTILLCSGIILSRAKDVIDGMKKVGIRVVEQVTENDWTAIAFMKGN